MPLSRSPSAASIFDSRSWNATRVRTVWRSSGSLPLSTAPEALDGSLSLKVELRERLGFRTGRLARARRNRAGRATRSFTISLAEHHAGDGIQRSSAQLPPSRSLGDAGRQSCLHTPSNVVHHANRLGIQRFSFFTTVKSPISHVGGHVKEAAALERSGTYQPEGRRSEALPERCQSKTNAVEQRHRVGQLGQSYWEIQGAVSVRLYHRREFEGQDRCANNRADIRAASHVVGIPIFNWRH